MKITTNSAQRALPRVSLVAQLVKDLPAMWEIGFDPWVGTILWRRERLPTPVFRPGEFHGCTVANSSCTVAKSQTQLRDFHFISPQPLLIHQVLHSLWTCKWPQVNKQKCAMVGYHHQWCDCTCGICPHFRIKIMNKRTWKKEYVFWLWSRNLPSALFCEIKNELASTLPEWESVAWEKAQGQKSVLSAMVHLLTTQRT